jgi:CubicO group peptidase (beta-lactamase class C family)
MSKRACGAWLALVAAVVLLQGDVRAQNATQNLALSLFERYLEPLRVQAAIPGLSAVIVQDGQPVWERGFGYRDVEGLHPALPDTPYSISDLTATITAALLGRCIDQGTLRLDEPIGTWVPTAEAPGTTLRQLVKHAAPTISGFRYDAARFALLAHPLEDCMDEPFRKLLARQVLDRFGMVDAVPGSDIASVPAEIKQLFTEQTLARYAANLSRMASPYKVDRRGRTTRSEPPQSGLDGSRGLIASARDLWRFDAALDEGDILSRGLLSQAWTPSLHQGGTTPFGMGWFVQTYQGEKLVWHFGHTADAYSSLILKVPARRLTLILLANSDGLSAPFPLAEGDVTTSLFARTFLRVFL